MEGNALQRNIIKTPMWVIFEVRVAFLAQLFCNVLLFLAARSCPTLLAPMDPHQTPPSMGFPRQEYWSGLLFPSPGNLPDPETEVVSPTPQVDSLPLTYLGSPYSVIEFGDYLAQAIV